MATVAHKRAAPLKRIRDLLSLAKSPNEHEAGLARIRAQELMDKHGIGEADLIETATEVSMLAPPREGAQRLELARVIAHSRNVTTMPVGNGNVSFKGLPEAAKDARDLFSAVTKIVEASTEIGGVTSDQMLWRTCFWLGFLMAVQQQLDPDHARIPREALPKLLKSTQAPVAIEAAAQAFASLSERLAKDYGVEQAFQAAEMFRETAHQAGMNLGMGVPVPPYKGKR